MPNTMYFTQCKDCEYCSLYAAHGYFCNNHDHIIDNPEVDGCTWGENKEEDNERKAD